MSRHQNMQQFSRAMDMGERVREHLIPRLCEFALSHPLSLSLALFLCICANWVTMRSMKDKVIVEGGGGGKQVKRIVRDKDNNNDKVIYARWGIN